MFVVIFEVQPKPDRWDGYLETAGLLRPDLVQVDGFLDNERFRSERTEGRVLSLSTWRDEKALIRWRTQATHHTLGQERGRFEIFADYHLRVGEVMADSAANEGAILGGQRFDVTEVGQATVVTLTEVADGDGGTRALDVPEVGAFGLLGREWFTSLTTIGKRIVLASWTDASAASAFRPTIGPNAWHRQVRIIRDYGMRDRCEAPQYFPDVD